jgi:hypothetical protein
VPKRLHGDFHDRRKLEAQDTARPEQFALVAYRVLTETRDLSAQLAPIDIREFAIQAGLELLAQGVAYQVRKR